MTNTKQAYDELVKTILYHNDRYYNQDDPEISDYEYDMLMAELKETEKAHPEWITPNSPTQRITGDIKPDLDGKVEHEVPMLSLLDYFSKDEVKEWVDGVLREYPDTEFVVEQKIDGLSLSLEYRDGKYKIGSTRGNGHVGEDVSENVKTLKNVPMTVEDIPLLEVRGECYMSQQDFLKANEIQEEKGEKLFKNARNCAAGSLRQKDASITKSRNLDLIVFNMQKIEGKDIKTHSETLEYMRAQGFQVSPDYSVCRTFDEVWTAIEGIGKKRGTLPYGIDGAVIKVNDLKQRAEMGETSKTPRWAIAYKYPPEQKTTIVRNIAVQVGRTGRLTPVAEFDGIELAGTTVKRATLHNQEQIARLNVNIGDEILVEKSGDIIPYISKVVAKHADGYFMLPDTCPVCGEPVEVKDGEKRCANPLCPAKLLRSLVHFADRPCMDIKGLGESNVQKLIDAGYLRSILDIYKLKDKREELIKAGIIGKEKSVDNLLTAIEKSKSCDASRFIKALGLPGIGAHAGEALVEKFGSVEAALTASFDDIASIDGLGAAAAETIQRFSENKENLALVRSLLDAGIAPRIKAAPANGKLVGLTFVITGTLPTLSRKEAETLVSENGGKVSGSVSRKTNFLLAGENAGSKLTKANELGIKVITEEELREMLNR